MQKAYEEIKRCLQNNEHNVSTETLQLALEALREVKEQKHNGYTNYPTWAVASVIDNNKELYDFYYGLKEELINSENAQAIIMNALQFDIELQMLKLFTGNENAIFQPILNDVVKEQINYHEIAINILE